MSMSRLSGRQLATLAVSSGIATLLLVPYAGISVKAQPSEDTAEIEVPTDPADAENDETNPESETAEPAEDSTATTAPRFTCQMHNGQYTVMYTPESQSGQAYAWAVPGDMGSNWPAQRRCSEISARLESYRPDGLLELQTSIENGYNVVCVTTEEVPNCRIVFTVPAGQDPMATRDQVFENLTLADSGQQTQGVNTLVGGESNILNQIESILDAPTGSSSSNIGNDGINLKPFLAPEDGGTGSQLPGNASNGRTLNPDNFR
jgi:hypothetical protein